MGRCPTPRGFSLCDFPQRVMLSQLLKVALFTVKVALKFRHTGSIFPCTRLLLTVIYQGQPTDPAYCCKNRRESHTCTVIYILQRRNWVASSPLPASISLMLQNDSSTERLLMLRRRSLGEKNAPQDRPAAGTALLPLTAAPAAAGLRRMREQ